MLGKHMFEVCKFCCFQPHRCLLLPTWALVIKQLDLEPSGFCLDILTFSCFPCKLLSLQTGWNVNVQFYINVQVIGFQLFLKDFLFGRRQIRLNSES